MGKFNCGPCGPKIAPTLHEAQIDSKCNCGLYRPNMTPKSHEAQIKLQV